MRNRTFTALAIFTIALSALFCTSQTADAADVWAFSQHDEQVYIVTESIRNTSTDQFTVKCKSVWNGGSHSDYTVSFGRDEGDWWTNGGKRVRDYAFYTAVFNTMIDYAPLSCQPGYRRPSHI